MQIIFSFPFRLLWKWALTCQSKLAIIAIKSCPFIENVFLLYGYMNSLPCMTWWFTENRDPLVCHATFQGRTYNMSLYLERIARDSRGIINVWPSNLYQRGSLLAQTYVMGSVLRIHTCLLFVLQFSTEGWRNERSHPNNEGKLTADSLWRLHTLQRECYHIQGNVFCWRHGVYLDF